MEGFIRHIRFEGVDYSVGISPTYNEILHKTDYKVSMPGFDPFLMVWEHGLNPGFKIQGVAPYTAHEMKELIAITIEHYYA